jgi:Fe-S-cluster formation regulator IscX/YfhJ
VKSLSVLSDFNEKNFLGRFSRNNQISNFMKLRSVGDELFHVDGRIDRQTDRQTDMTKVIVAFRNFVNAPIKSNTDFRSSSLCHIYGN